MLDHVTPYTPHPTERFVARAPRGLLTEAPREVAHVTAVTLPPAPGFSWVYYRTVGSSVIHRAALQNFSRVGAGLYLTPCEAEAVDLSPERPGRHDDGALDALGVRHPWWAVFTLLREQFPALSIYTARKTADALVRAYDPEHGIGTRQAKLRRAVDADYEPLSRQIAYQAMCKLDRLQSV